MKQFLGSVVQENLWKYVLVQFLLVQFLSYYFFFIYLFIFIIKFSFISPDTLCSSL